MMTAEQYLSQAYRLDQRIQLEQSELDNDAPFVKTLERIWEMEQKISTELSQLILLKQEILKVLSKVNDVDERLVLTYRYLKNMSWSEISIELGVSDRTIRRWHERALTHVVVPESAEEMGE